MTKSKTLVEVVEEAKKLRASANGCKIKMSTTFTEGATNVKYNEGMDFIHFMAGEGYEALIAMDTEVQRLRNVIKGCRALCTLALENTLPLAAVQTLCRVSLAECNAILKDKK
jgi:hypothetical protein